MAPIKYIIFRYLTAADYFNMYKLSGTEHGGGGQAYVDFPTAFISLTNWGSFFEGAESVSCSTGRQGPIWEFPVKSIGLDTLQDLKVYQRRPQSICIASQKITSSAENRVKSWHPDNGFPSPEDPTKRNSVPNDLMIFILRTVKNDFWAGWLDKTSSYRNTEDPHLKEMFLTPHEEGYAGFLNIGSKLFLNEKNTKQPFSLSQE